MNLDPWVTLAVIVAVVAVLAFDRLPTALAMSIGLLVLFVSGTIDDEVALSGLSSPATATIGLLYIVAGGIAATGAVSWLIDRWLLGSAVGITRAAIRPTSWSTDSAAIDSPTSPGSGSHSRSCARSRHRCS